MPKRLGEKSPLQGFPRMSRFLTKQEIDGYFSNPDGIQCLLCGRVYGALGGHLQMVHGISHEEYRDTYGLPWRRGLVSTRVSMRLRTVLTERIRNGSFKPEPDNKAAVEKIRAGGRRKDQPFVTADKALQGKGQSKKNRKYGRKDFEKVLSAMLEYKTTLRQACMDKGLPPEPTVLLYAELNSRFRKKLLGTYHALPYAVQARADMFSPQFYKDLKRLKRKGLSATEIREELQVSRKTIWKRLTDLLQLLKNSSANLGRYLPWESSWHHRLLFDNMLCVMPLPGSSAGWPRQPLGKSCRRSRDIRSLWRESCPCLQS
jgi:hypothetical protein